MTFTPYVPNYYPNIYTTPIQTTIIQPVKVVQAAQKQDFGKLFKPKQTGKNTSHVVFILDESGSMSSHYDQTLSGFNEFLETHKKDEIETKIPTFISLFKFNGFNVNQVYNREPVQGIAPLNKTSYRPSGGTNLIDSIGAVMQTINQQLSSQRKSNRDHVIITILTDGEENSSKTFDNNDIKQMVSKAEEKNWAFIFLGANMDAFKTSSVWGFSQNNTLHYDTHTINAAIRSSADMSTRLKMSVSEGNTVASAYVSSAFTDKERNESNGK